MVSWLLEQTSLPNFHPALVHFPIAVLPLALLAEAIGLCRKKHSWLEPAAASLYLATLVFAYVALQAGESAADGLVGVKAGLQPLIGAHSDWAHYTFYALLLLAPFRVGLTLWDKKRDRRWLRTVPLVLGVGTMGLLFGAADRGGALVYRHALSVAVQHREPLPGDSAESESDAPSLTTDRDGTVRWIPRGAEAVSLAPMLGVQGTDYSFGDDGAEGLLVQASGTTLLGFPSTFGDVEVTARVNLVDFQGTLGVFHHAADLETLGGFRLSSGGEALLYDTRKGKERVLDRGAKALPKGEFRFAVSAAGKHLKGILNGETVAHGHIAPGADGAAGLSFQGTGTFRLLELSVTPISDR